jgi:prephenate dehydratase
MSDSPEADAALPRVGYLGPAGTFSEEAVLASAREGEVEPLALASIGDAVAAVRDGRARWSVVPIENSLEGSINVTLDLLAGACEEVEVVGEALLRVRHSLIAAEAVELGEIETVLTHPQVPGQCSRFLRETLPHARVMPATSTAEAVRGVVVAGERTSAAIGTALAAAIYGGTVVREGIEDREDNQTRFVWVAAAGGGDPPVAPLRDGERGEWKTSLVFWGVGSESPGWLVRCLDEFARRDINLTRIESRPRRQQLGSYMFFADLAAQASDERVAAAISGVRDICERALVLGSYRAAQSP